MNPPTFLRSFPSHPIWATGLVAFVLALPVQGQEQETVLHREGYVEPPARVAEAVTAPRHENVILSDVSPEGYRFVHTVREDMVGLTDLARPFQRLGGLALDPRAQRSRDLWVRGDVVLVLTSVDDGSSVRVDAPAGARIGGPEWSPDGSRIAYLAHFPDESHVYLADAATGESRRVTRTPLVATLVTDVHWSGDGRHLFAVVRPPAQGAPPTRPQAPTSPLVRMTSPEENRLRTFPSLLRGPHERELLEHFITGQVVRIDVTAEEPREEPIGEPAMVRSLSPAPAGDHLRVSRIAKPFSHIVPVRLFADVDEIWDLEGRSLVELERREVRHGTDPDRDDEPEEAERRHVTWRPDRQGLSFLQRGPPEESPESPADPGADAASPEDEESDREGWLDRVVQWLPPFDEESRHVVYETEGRIRELAYSGDASTLFLTEREGSAERLHAVFLDEPDEEYTLYEWDTDDFHANPGSLLEAPNELGVPVVRISSDGRSVYLSGTRYSETPLEEAPRPFVDRVEIRTGESERVFESAEEIFEEVSAVLDDDASRLVLRRESPTMVPDSWLLERASGELTRLTENVDHTPDLTGARREVMEVTRPDGITFQVRVTLPPDYQEGQRLPAMLWFYPREYTDQDSYDESTRTYNRNRFPALAPRSIEILARHGYVVIQNDHPIIGSEESWNNNYVVDLRANLLTVIDAVDARGWIDRRRLGLGGHSYGGFGTINAMVQTPYFRAGIAGAPNSNRLLTPIGFQRERRALWDARETYLEMSPFLWAERLSGALLIYHGEDDQNVGTFPDNSWRLIHALNGLGKTAALYMYPFEGHGQVARETLLDMWARWVAWLDHYVKDADPDQPVQPVLVQEEESDREGH